MSDKIVLVRPLPNRIQVDLSKNLKIFCNSRNGEIFYYIGRLRTLSVIIFYFTEHVFNLDDLAKSYQLVILTFKENKCF